MNEGSGASNRWLVSLGLPFPIEVLVNSPCNRSRPPQSRHAIKTFDKLKIGSRVTLRLSLWYCPKAFYFWFQQFYLTLYIIFTFSLSGQMSVRTETWRWYQWKNPVSEHLHEKSKFGNPIVGTIKMNGVSDMREGRWCLKISFIHYKVIIIMHVRVSKLP